MSYTAREQGKQRRSDSPDLNFIYYWLDVRLWPRHRAPPNLCSLICESEGTLICNSQGCWQIIHVKCLTNAWHRVNTLNITILIITICSGKSEAQVVTELRRHLYSQTTAEQRSTSLLLQWKFYIIPQLFQCHFTLWFEWPWFFSSKIKANARTTYHI